MERKPEIQYVAQFYVLGSAAPQTVQKPKKKALPRLRSDRVKKVYVDPFALCGMAVAVAMLVVLVIGAVRLEKNWELYNRTSDSLSELRRENAQLEHRYRTTFDLEKVRTSAEGMGMIPRSEAPNATVWVTVPTPKQAPGWLDEVKWFLKGLFAQ